MKEDFGKTPFEENDPPDVSSDDFEYFQWVQAREQETLEAKFPKKVTVKEALFTGFFVLFILVVAVYLPFKAVTGNNSNHESYSVWVEDLSIITELVVAEYVFLGSNQVSGVYFSNEDLIIIERHADSSTFIHELAHAADRHNYFAWEGDLKEVLYSTYTREQLYSPLFNGTTSEKIKTELFADALVFIETGHCGNYFSGSDCYVLAVATKDFVEINDIALVEKDSPVDYLTPDIRIDGPITKSSDINHLL